MTGQSLAGILRSRQVRLDRAQRNVMLVGKERHDLGRPNDWGYPVRAIRTTEYLYVHNFHPDRWPAGNPGDRLRQLRPKPDQGSAQEPSRATSTSCRFGKRPPDELYDLRTTRKGSTTWPKTWSTPTPWASCATR